MTTGGFPWSANAARGEPRPVVLVVSPTPPPCSGPEIMTEHLLRSPLRERFRLVHFNISKKREVATKARFDWVNVLYGVLQPLQMLGRMMRHRPALVYTNLAQNPAGFLRYFSFIAMAKLGGARLVVRVMGDGFHHFYRRSGAPLRWLIRRALARVDRIIIRAEALKPQFDGLVERAKLRVVYSGIDPEEFAHRRSPEGERPLRVLFVGYLTAAKGALDLLAAVPRVVARCPGTEFWLMGPRIDKERNVRYVKNPSSNEQALNQLLAREDIRECVQLLGVKSGRDKARVFAEADLFVLPSHAEAFPTVVLEAMAAGLPVVATPVGALPEAFDEESIAFAERGNVEALAERIVELLRSPDQRRRMGARNREVVRRRFSLRQYADRVGEVFQEVLAGGVAADVQPPLAEVAAEPRAAGEITVGRERARGAKPGYG